MNAPRRHAAAILWFAMTAFLLAPAAVRALPAATFEKTKVECIEHEKQAQFDILLSPAPTATVKVYLLVRGNAMSGGVDYDDIATTVTFTAGQARKTITAAITDDHFEEDLETIALTIIGGEGTQPGTSNTGLEIQIHDDDTQSVPTEVNFGAPASLAAENSGRVEVIMILNQAPGVATTIDYSVSGTAVAGVDFQPLSGTVNVAADATEASIVVTTIDDGKSGPDKSLAFRLTGISGTAHIGPKDIHVLTIQDSGPKDLNVQFVDRETRIKENGGKVYVQLVMSDVLDHALTVRYMLGGSAKAGADYTAPTGTVIFPKGQTGAQIVITILDDALLEEAETIEIALTDAEEARLGSIADHTVYIIDDEKPYVEFTATTSKVDEDAQTHSVTLALNKSTTETVTVLYTVAGTAKPGKHYKALSGGVTFAANTTTKNIDLDIYDDDKENLDRTILLSLYDADRADLGERTTHTVTIVNDDKPPDDAALAISPPGVAGSVPDVGVDALGRAHIIWRQRLGTQYWIWYARVAGGAVDMPARALYYAGTSANFRPRCAVGPDGQTYVILHNPTNSFLTFVKFQDGRSSPSQSFQLFNPGVWPTQAYYWPAIDLNPYTRRPYIVAECNMSRLHPQYPGLTQYWNGVIGVEMEGDGARVGGTLWAPYYLLNSAPLINMATRPDVAVDRFGQPHCAWVQKDRDWGGAIGIAYARRGGAINAFTELTDPSIRNVLATGGGPRLACQDDGAADVIWSAQNYKNAYWWNGSTNVRRQILDTSATAAYQPDAISSGNSHFFVWTDQREGPKQIFYKTQLKRSRPRNLARGAGDAFDASLARGTSDTAAVVWADARDGTQRIYYRAISGTIWIKAAQNYDRESLSLSLTATARDGLRGPVTDQNKNVKFTWKLKDGSDTTLSEGSLEWDKKQQLWSGGVTFTEELLPGFYTVYYEVSYVDDHGELREGETEGQIFAEHFFSLSGRVTDAKTKQPIQNVKVRIGALATTTNASGKYSFQELRATSGLDLYASHLTHKRFHDTINVGPREKVVVFNFTMSPASPKPEVVAVDGEVEGIFLYGVDSPNVYTAEIEWGSGDPKFVDFSINGKLAERVYTGTTEAKFPINMNDTRFIKNADLGRNVITVIAESTNGRSKPFVKPVRMIPVPDFTKWFPAIEPLALTPWIKVYEFSMKFPNSEGSLQERLLDKIPLLKKLCGYMQVAFGFKLEVITGNWEVSTGLVFGKSKDQIKESRLGKLSLDKLFYVTKGVKPGLEVGPVSIEFEVNAKVGGVATEKNWINIQTITGAIALGTKVKLWELYFTDALPATGPVIRAFDKLTSFLTGLGFDFMSLIRVNIYGKFKVEASIGLVWKWPPGWDKGEISVEIGPEIAYEPELGGLKLNLYAGGQVNPKIYIAQAGTPDWIKFDLLRAKLYGGIEVQFWAATVAEAKVTIWEYPAQTPPGPGKIFDRIPTMEYNGQKFYVLSSMAEPHPIARPGLKGANRFVANDAAAGSPAAKTGQPLGALEAFRSMTLAPAQRAKLGLAAASLPLIQNVFTNSDPALAASGNKLMLLFVADNGNASPYQFTDVNWMAFDGTNWTAPAPIAADNLGEFAPTVAYDGSGNAVAAWERISDPTITTPDIDAMAAKHEIVYSYKTPAGNWTAPAALTANAYLDFKPRLCGPLSDGSLLLVWMANQRNLFMGQGADGTTSNSQVMWRKWTAATKTWSAAQTMIPNLTRNMSDALAGRGAAAIYAWTRDEDGILSTTQDREIYTCSWNGAGWNAPARLTNDAMDDNYIRAAVTAGGKTFLTWSRDNNLVLNAELTSTTAVRMDALTAGEKSYTITAGPSDNIAMVWQDMSEDGSDAHYSVYDPLTGRWGQKTRLFQDPALERSFAAAWDNTGNLTVAYNKVDIQHTTQTFPLDGGGSIAIPNYPTRGQTDLGIVKTSLGCDLALAAGDLLAWTDDSRPGGWVTLQAHVANKGNLPATAPAIAFYDGAPTSLTEIARVNIPGWLDGGAETTVTAEWTVPAVNAAHTLYAVADPDRAITETSRANNTVSISFGGVDLEAGLGETRVFEDGSGWAIARLQNLGTVSAPASLVGLRRAGAQSPMLSASAPAVPPGTIVEVSLDLPRGTVPPGSIGEFNLTADENRATGDVDRANNTLSFSIANAEATSPIQFVTSAQTVPIVEGTRRAFTVKLSDRPTTTVQAQVVRVSGDADLSVATGGTLTFARDTWTSAVTVTLNAAADADTLDGQAVFAVRETTATGMDDACVTALELDSGAVHTIGQGSLTGATAWNDALHDYVLTGTVTVPAGATLRIGPGATVRLTAGAGKTALVIQGTLETTDTLFILETRHNASTAARVNGINVASGGQASFRRCTLLTRELGGVFAGNYADWSAAVAAAGTARLNVYGCAFEALDGTGGARTPLALATEDPVTAKILTDSVSGRQNAFTAFDTGLDWRAGAGLKQVDPFLFAGCRWSVRLQGAAATQDVILKNPGQALAGPLALGAGRRLDLEPGSELTGDSANAGLTIPAGARMSVVRSRLTMTAPIAVAGQLDASSSTLLLHTGAQWVDAQRRNGIDLQGGGVANLAACNLVAAEDNYTGEWSALIAQSGLSRLSVSSCSLTLYNPAGLLTTCAIRCAGTRVLDVRASAFLGNFIGIRFDAVPTTVTLRDNAFQGSLAYAVQNRTATDVDARQNWWGAVSGPTHASNPAGTGDRVSDHVIFANRLTRPPATMSALIDPAAGQETGNLTAAAEQPATELIGLRASPPGREIRQLVFHLSHRGGTMAWSKIANFRLLMDTNGNGAVDPEETSAVGGAPLLGGDADNLWVTFTEPIVGTEDPACAFILLADLGRLASGDGFVVELAPGAALMSDGTPFLMQVTPVTHVRGGGGAILGDRPGGQFGNHLGSAATQKGVELFAFSLSGAGRTVTRLDVNLTAIAGIAAADLTSASLFLDLNGNGQRDAGEPKVAGPGTVAITGATGSIRFATSFAAGQTYLLTADLANLAAGDTLTFNLTPGYVVLDKGQATGSVHPATHKVETPISVTGLSSSYLTDVLLPARVVYRDLAYAFSSSIPWCVYKQIYIRTLNSQRDQVSSGLIGFSVNRRVRIYVGLDDLMPAAPAWLTGWTIERDRLPTNDPHPGRRLYSKPFNSGPITLGGNRDAGGATGYQMYTVVIAPESGPVNEAADWALYE